MYMMPVDKAIGTVADHYARVDLRWLAVIVYCFGMAVLSPVMDPGFASFLLTADDIGVRKLIGTLAVIRRRSRRPACSLSMLAF